MDMHRRKRSALANVRLPNDLLTMFSEQIQQLQSRPSTDYLKKEMLSKFVSEDTDPPAVRRQRAINKWLSTESDNEATRERLLLTPEDYQILPRVTFDRFVSHCQNLIIEIIGEVPPVDALIGAFSGGASTSRGRKSSYPAGKYLGIADVTPSALETFQRISDEMPGWIGEVNPLEYRLVDGNVLFTVPKKTDIDRVACKEPDINMFLQKGIGSFFRKCLLRTGINLNDQSINRSLAQRGSLLGDLSTLDLSSASDSVTSELVRLLLPVYWYSVMDDVRSPYTIIDGEKHRNVMFSSMGNGFTFELESLLFYSIAKTVAYMTGTRGIISVYGDDIICPTEMSDDLIWVLGWFGFQVNPDKSFKSGPFRESCGGHFFNGYDITPFYIRSPIKTLPDLIDLANKLRQWGTIEGLGICDPEVEPIWLWLKSFIPRCLWGGGDTTFKFQLVSRDTPSMRIHLDSSTKDSGTGGYYHWLNATWARSSAGDGLTTSRRSVDSGRLRLRRVRDFTVPRLPAWFIHELG